MGNFFKTRRKLKIAVILVVALILIGALSSHGSKNNDSPAADSSANAAPREPSIPLVGKIPGSLQDPAYCLGCDGQLAQYVQVDRIWCAWQGNNVIVHAQFRNSSVEKISIDWHPSYTIQDGGSHGTGLTSMQHLSLDGHSAKGEFVKQKPKGVPPGSPIASCDPALSTVSSG
jgi:hypothetical protein